MKNTFDRLAPFIQDFIYQNNWSEIRPIQVAACDIILDTDKNLLLSSGTASGKTEAAFLPILTDIYENPGNSVEVLYISPLKALINDQFKRVDELLKQTDIPVTKWHGDVSQTLKNKIIKNPKGIIQITPESLEAMLMRNRENVIKMFHDLKYIVIDEVHYFMNDDRGYQLLCILERLQRLIGKVPRRIGLSATLGDYTIAKDWLNSGTTRECAIPQTKEASKKIRLFLKYFSISSEEEEVSMVEYYQYLYERTLNKKCILFSNSKSEVEANISNLKKIAGRNHTKDIYYVHHANISTSLREYAEEQMKNEEETGVTGATLTLELGIDLGKLDRIVQTGSPFSVSSFVQRLGRSGRRDNPSEMLFVFKKEENSDNAEFYKTIDFEFLKCIAIIQLYLGEKWIEPTERNTLNFSLLYHQTMSYLFSVGSAMPKELASQILTLAPFKDIEKEDYKNMLRYLILNEQIEKDENEALLIGMKGERKVNNFNFFSVFNTNLEYSVKNDSQEIGTVQIPYPVRRKICTCRFYLECSRY